MSMSQTDLTNYLSRLLSPATFEDYAPNGLQVSGKEQLKRIAFSVSATMESLKLATSWGADALIVHHGIFWKHEGARPVTGAWGERVKTCVKHDLNLYAYHLPLDAHPEVGNAAALAKKLKLGHLQPFALYKKQPMGVKGKFATPRTALALKNDLQIILGHAVILASPDESREISSLGIITGGANNDWVKALEDGLDGYLTGEISEYNWHDSIEAGIHYFAGGHHATERFGIMALQQKIKAEFPGVECKFFDSENLA
ncbi:MAG TPA: Nif3-like dinuclear metal center hexameric protein [Bacteriovoracaceae bacterium]|nr:Nif3-like dinuclear metal center hexameric protein [Bacteriovoracaceae bacterium]